MKSGIYNRVGGHPKELENQVPGKVELKLSMNPYLSDPAFNFLGTDGTEYYETINSRTSTYDTSSG